MAGWTATDCSEDDDWRLADINRMREETLSNTGKAMEMKHTLNLLGLALKML